MGLWRSAVIRLGFTGTWLCHNLPWALPLGRYNEKVAPGKTLIKYILEPEHFVLPHFFHLKLLS